MPLDGAMGAIGSCLGTLPTLAKTRRGGGPARDDIPQVVIGMGVTRDGIPVRVWCWPGNTADSALIRQVKDDMRDWPRTSGS